MKMWALLLAASAPAMLVVAPMASAQVRTDGRNLSAVMVDAGPNAQFVQQSGNRWAELDTNGRPVSFYRERARDEWSVYLVDPSRGIEIQLDVFRRKVTIAEAGRPRRDLYNITRFTSTGSTYPREDVRDRDARDRDSGWRDGGSRDARDGGGRGRDERGGETRPIEAGPIWSQRDAENKCRAKADEMRGEWTGGWWTTVPGRMSVCEIRFSRDRGGWGRDRRDDDWGRDGVRDVEVGPIWDQRDADYKCRARARELDTDWTGAWSTVRPGMSVCGMRRRSGGGGYGNNGGGYGNNQGVTREFEVGPLWSQRDAETKCRAKAVELRGEWTGQWRTTVQGRMSVCEIRLR